MKESHEIFFTGMTTKHPNNPPNSTTSPASLPITSIILIFVVFPLIMPMAASSAIIPAILLDGVELRMQIISRPTEQTLVMASDFSSVPLNQFLFDFFFPAYKTNFEGNMRRAVSQAQLRSQLKILFS